MATTSAGVGEREMTQKTLSGDSIKQAWLTPPDVFKKLEDEFHFTFDPCPFPYERDGIDIEWGSRNFVNPPFRRKDSINGHGPTAFVRKAIEEQQNGKTSVLIIPTQSYVNMLIEAGAELRSLGRVRWIDTVTREPTKQPSPITCFILRGHDG